MALPDAMAPPPRDAAYMLLARTPAAAKDASAPPAANVERLVVLVGSRRAGRESERPVLFDDNEDEEVVAEAVDPKGGFFLLPRWLFIELPPRLRDDDEDGFAPIYDISEEPPWSAAEADATSTACCEAGSCLAATNER